jgi:hypothetical protein
MKRNKLEVNVDKIEVMVFRKEGEGKNSGGEYGKEKG